MMNVIKYFKISDKYIDLYKLEIGQHLIDILNKEFKGWVLLKNPHKTIEDVIFFVLDFTIDYAGGLNMNVNSCSINLKKNYNEEDPVSIENYDYTDYSILENNDIIYKLYENENINSQSKIKWYSKGKLENLKTFEEYKIKWYNKGNFDYQEEQEDDKKYNDFIPDDEFRKFLLDNGAYDEYVKIARENYKNNMKNSLDLGYISTAFNWDSSPSGWNYWNNLNVQWKNIVWDKNKY